MAEDRIDQLYSYLKQGGIVSKDRESFRKKMLAPGQEGYKNRYTIWKIMHDNGFTGYDSYEDFAKNGLGLHAVPSPTSQGGGRVGGAAAVQRHTQPTKPKRQGGDMSAAERARFINNTQGMVNSSAAAIQRTKNQMDYAKGNAGLKVKPVHLGQNSKVVKRNTDGTVAEQRPVLDMAPQEQPGQTYVTESGNEYGNRAEADTEQNAVDQYNYDNSLDGQLNNAYAERDRLDEALKRRRAELEDKPWWRRALEDMGKATHSDLDPMATANDPEHQGYENDEEYMQLMSAARKNHQTIQTLEDKKNGKMNDFWHSFGTTAMNGYTFADGMPELRDATALEYAKKHIKAINEKRQKGLPLTREEQAAEAVLKANDTDNAVQSMYGDYGAWGRVGGMTANTVDFMKDFLLMPGGAGMAKGIAGKVAGIGGKMLAKEAGESALKAIPKTIARATLKATGVLVGVHTAGSVISNTTGIGRTAALMAQKASGNVTRDEKGGYKIENEQSLMHALASAEREQARENGSEMFGEFIPGGKLLGGLAKKGLEKIGLSKVSNFLTQIGNKEWYKQYSQFLKTGGYNGIPGEALEEYEGELFDALTGHASDAWKDFTDAKQNTDIWLGCATMGALMGAIPMGIHMGGYYKFRHDMNKADKVAAYRMTKDKWVPLKEELDNTDNGHMADVVTKRILMNNELSAQEKKAAMDYVRGLTNFRGFNIAQASNAGDEESQANQARNDAYRTGYNAVDDAAAQQQPTEPIATGSDGDSAVYGGAQDGQQQTGQQGASPTEHDIKIAYEQARDGVAGMYGEDFVQQLDDDPDAVLATLEDESRGKQKAQAYVDAKAMYDGMMQRAKDDLDDKVQTVENEVDSHVNPVDQGGDGMIHPATMKVKNDDGTEHQVYIVSGHVEMMADGTMVDKTKSSPSIVIRDTQTGETKMVSPDDILSVDEPIDPEQEKQTAVEAARQEFAGQRADQIDGLAPKQNPQMNDEVWVKDENDEPVHGVVTQVDPVTGEYMVRTDKAVNGKVAQPFQAGQLYEMATTTGAAAEQRPTEPSFNEQQTETEATDNEQQTETEQPTETETTETGQPAETEADADLALKGTAQNHTEGEVQAETREDGQPQRAIDRIPSEQVTDKKGNTKTVHHWEQAEPGDTWDALNEQYQDEKRTQHKVGIRVKKIDDQIKSLDKQIKKLDDSDDFDADFNDADGYKTLLEQKKELETQKKYWQQVQSVPQQRKLDEDRRTAEEKAAAEAARKQAEAEAIERARQEREQVKGVPDVVNDKPGDARQRGFRNVNGSVVERQQGTGGVTGRESNVKFSSKDTAKGHVKVIDADELQPSHVSGQRNPRFFIDEAQPKDRTDAVSSMAAEKIASSLNPEEITGDGSAYQFSAPTVNSRGEVIQGNNRSDALKLMWSSPAYEKAQTAYKQYIADHAEEFGFTPEDVEKIQQMEHPVMVNELDVPDDEAIRLGQMKASDNESGGVERIDPVTTSQKLGHKVGSFANVLLSSADEDASLSDVMAENGGKAVKWLATQGAISDTAAQSAFDKKGNLTPEARMDLQNILKQSLFQGGVSDLPTMFGKMPAKAQKAILSTFMRDFDSAESERILPEMQKAIEAWYDCAMSNEAFAKAPNYKAAKAAMRDWESQTNLLDDNMPSDKFSNFAMELACRMQGCTMRETQQNLNDFFDLVQGKSQGDLFGGTTAGEQADRQEAIRRVFDIEYKPISNKNNGEKRSNVMDADRGPGREGGPGGTADGKGRERAESGSGSANGAGGTESHDEEGIKATHPSEDSSHRDDSNHSIGATSSSEKKEAERQGVNTEPSEKQKEAGNYKKGHIKVDGYDITIENPKGSTRSGKDASGKAWSVPMHYDYGYIKGTEGVDGDHIDVYLSDNPTSGNVYVVDQIDQKTGKFDEHKVMYGFPSKEAAVEAYKRQYTDGWKVGTVTEVSREDFKKWVESSRRKTKPFSEYKSVKDAAQQQEQLTDLQGNPILPDGTLIRDAVSSIDQITDEYFTKPFRSVQLPIIPRNIDKAIGANGKPVIIKKNIFEKNAKTHQFTPAESRRILKEALYNTDLVGRTQPKKRPNHWVAIKVDEESPITVLEVNENKDNVEVVGWYRLDDRNLGRIKRQAEREGGELLILTPKGAAASLSTLPLNSSSVGKDKQSSPKKQEKTEKKNEGQFGLVSDERMEELKKRLRAKLNNLNMGVDPEVLAIGLELTAGYIDRGVKKFAEYSKAMINDLGDVVRPYLKAFYNGVRDMPEITSNGLDAEMDDYETVSKFNVATIGKEGEEVKPSILDTAEQVSNESHVERAASNVSDEDVKSEQKKLKGEDKTSGLHEVNTDRLFKDLKAGKTVVLNDYYKDEDMSKGMDLMIEEAHDKFLSKLNTFKEKPTREMLEKALKDREQWIDELADMFKKGKTEGVVNGKYQKKVDVAGSLAIMLGERKAIQELLGMDLNGGSTAQQRPTELSTSAERTEQNPTEHGTTETDTSVADSKRKQFDLFVKWDLERFIGKSKAKRVTVDWEHSEPENDYLPMKIDGEPSFVGVTEQDGEGDEIDRPIAIYDIAEGGDFPDVPKTAEFEAYAKDYNAENNLTENSDDYATMDANNPYVAFRSVDAAVKFNDWLHEKGKGAAAEQRRTEPSEKKENTRYSERGFTLRPATEEDVDSNKAIYVNGKRTHIVMVVRKGEQVGAAQFSHPVIEAVYTTDNERVPLSKIEVEDLPTTVHLKTAGDFYEAYGNDAVALGEVTGVSVVTRKDGTRMAGFPKKMLDEYEQGLRNNGWDVSVDGMATKKATENILQQLQSAPKARTSTNAIKNALRGKKTSSKENNEKKKAVSSQQDPSLFDDLFGGKEVATKRQPTEQKATQQTSERGTAEQKPAVISTDDEKGKEKPIETKPAEELSGDSKEYQARAKAEQEFVERIKGMITEAAKDGRSLTMSDIKKAYNDELDGNWELPNDYKDTDLQELVERAMTLATREVAIGAISKNTSEAVREGYDKVVKLYESQPSLNARDSSRVAHQQYSTPTPFGYVMDMFMMGGDKKPLKLLEPSAGNGALTIGIPAPLWHVNDIDERRLMNLRTMPYGKITNQDGTMPFEPKAYDAVATNPPFGSTQEKEFDGGRTKISSLEGLMAINALASMKDDGRAAIIIGGNTQYMSNGAMQAKDMKLFKHLYTHYNVVDVINLDGDMYKRNGTGYNVRMILIAGRKTDVGDNPEKFTFPPVKKKARAEQVKTFDELYKRVEDDIQRAKQMERESPVAVNSNGSHTVNSASERTGNSETAGGVQQQPVRAGEVERRPQPGRTVRPSSAQDGRGNGERGQHGSADRLDHADQRNAGSNHAVSGNGSAQGQSSERRESGSTGRRAVGGTERGRTAQRDNANGKRLEVTGNSAAVQQRPTEPSASREKVELGQEKVAYPNKSQSMTLQSRVPAAQAEAIAENLDKLGDVDEMVRSELGYSSKDELYSHLAAEQIDSVALAINQMKHGKGFIIGDMTGVGKGRQGAALIRWAIKQGKTPIYFTQKARLYTDNYRDMCDIGSKGLHPFLIASNDDGNIVENVVDENGEKVYDKNGEPVTRVVYGLPKPKERERVYDYILQNGKLPPEYDYVLVTYSQIQSGTKTYEIGKNGEIEVKDKKYKGKKPTGADTNGDVRRDVLEKLAKDNYVFLDESHTVGGQSSSGLYMQDMLKGAEGVTYLSATFAKRPDNMPLYAMKTAMSESGLSQKDMIDAIQKGGVTLQEIMSKQLVQSGQMIRRERDFSGVSIDWEGVDEETDQQQRAQFDEVAKIFNAIREFQDTYVDPSIEKMSEDMAEEGKFSKKTQGTSHMGVNNVPFASKMYNLVNQLLFSLKANAVADKAIECLKKGEKPVISFNNTMEGFLDDMPRNTPMPELPNFSLTLMRALEGTLRYTEGEIGNKDNQVNKTLNINDLSDEAVAEYNKIRKTILNLSIGLPIDPMDAIKMRIEAAGYKVGEITGRKSEMVKDADGNYIVQSRSSKEMDGKAAASAFNSASGKNGGLDVLLINKSGSTGISLHASSKFSDQSPRVMIAAQFQSDINDEVQMRGRIDRTGQVHRGRYIYLVSSIPAEQRLQMMFKNKLKSLDANTTSSQKSKFNEMEVTDFMNKYGDEVTWSYMMEHPDLEERLGDPLDMLSDESKKSNRRDGDEENNQNSGCAGKILRRLPFLSVKEQEQIFNDLADAYKVKMQILNDAGENDLEITTMPLRAETKSRKVWKQGSDPGSDNAFADNTYLETAEVDVLKKPMKAKEVREYADRLTDGKPWEQWHQEQHEAVEQFYADKAEAVEDKAKADAQKRIDMAREDYIKGCLKARKKGDNNWSDEEISHMADIAAKEAADKEQTKINKRTVSIDAQLNDVLEALDAFTPLEPLIIPLNLKDTSTTVIPSLGTFLGIKFGKGYSRSSSTAVFATLDGRRKIEVPLSDKTSLENIKHQSVMLGYQARGLNMDNWDSKVPTKSRKTAYIVTGNLMQALVDTQKAPETKGQLISYTTIDGDVKQGILMNDRFKVEDLKTSVPISAMLQKVKEGDAVESTDKEVTIERGTSYHYNDYKLSVPKSKSRGGKYFLDKKLLRLLDDEFTTSGGNMVSWVSESNLKKVLDYLSKDLGVTVQVKANLEEAADSPHNDEPATPSEAEEGGVLYREVDDEEAARLDSEPTVKVYRAMQEHDGKLYPPMSGRVKTQVETKNGNMRTKWVWRSPIEIGKWEQSEEHPEMANEDGTFTLDKGNGSKINAAYNPYIHTSRTPINDQFSSAWNRPELVTVEVEVPASELTSGYHAEKAKDATGEVEWKSGPVGREMAAQGKPRMVILSRWDKPVRIVPVEEVADEYAVRLAGTGIKVPFNTVPPALREALVARGVEISEPEEGNAGKASRPSYEEWLKGNTRHREGSGAYSDEELSLMNDPVAKWLGKSNRTKAQQKAFANRERRSMESAVRELADRLHLDNVNIVMDASTLEGRKARAKGFYDRNTGQITIVIPNHRDVDDVMQTLLHEGVAHYGLRQLFGEHFDTFLRNVYEAADNEVRRKIIDLALHKYGGNFETATEEYLASLAERTNFENMPYTFWTKIKELFLKMLHAIGFEDFARTGVTLSDNELRYILWRSYENLKEPGRFRSILGEAEDVAKQAELKVGNYGEAAAVQRRTQPSTTEQQAVEQQPTEREQEAAEGDGVAEALSARADEIRNMPSVSIMQHDTSREYVREQYNKLGTAINKRDGKKVTFYHGVFGKMWRGENSLFAKIAPQLKDLFESSIYGFSSEDLLAGKKRPDGTIHKAHRNIDNYDYYVGKASINGKDYYVRFTVQNSEMRGNSGVHDVMVTDVSIYENSTGDASASRRITGERLVANGTISDAKLMHLFGFDVNNSEKDADTQENVSEPAAWGKQDLLSKAEQISRGIEPDLLFRDTIEDDDDTARETYNRMADRARETFREAWQDSMINVRRLQEAVLKQRGEKMEDWEDAYNEENRSHGHAQDLDEYFDRTLYKPLLKAVNAVAKAAKVSIGDVTEYMMAKHGLERNEVFARRDAQAAYDKAMEKAKGTYDALMKAANAESDPKKKDALEKQAQKVTFPDFDDLYQRFRRRDYAGLTDLTGQSDVQDAEVEAKRIVADMESRAINGVNGSNGVYGGSPIDELWKATNEATGWTLEKAYESGIISKDNYEQVSRMFQYYIPLRGWKEDTAEDLYDYVGGGNKGTAFSPTLHKAKGRRSEADNPIAYISSMAVSAIEQGRKNLVKQSFMRFVENHPTNLVAVSEMWYRNYGTDAAPDWREDVPNIPEDATADEIADIVKQHEDDMKQLEAQGLATKERGRLHLGVPVKQGQALEHHVEVLVNGKKYVLYINGNPRAAQALNGTRQRRASDHGVTRTILGIADNFANMKGFFGKRIAKVLRGLATMHRAMSAFFTSKNPAFMLRNAFRDVDMALASTIIDEPIKYAHLFRMNMLRLGGPIGMIRLMHWYNKEGAGMEFADMKNMKTMQRYFYEFVKGGGRTGFTSLRDIEDYKEELAAKFEDLKRSKVSPVLLFKDLADCFEYCNRAVEDMTRFATFVAAREYGKSVRESVSDAKNITLNFNRKGSGEMGNVQVRDLIIFVNPAIQALDRIGSMARRHPVKFSAYTAIRVLAGMGTPFMTMLLWNVFGGGDGDDDDKWNAVEEYWKLPTWTRRNNLVFWIPMTKKFAMIPLAQEMRVANGFGEALTSELTGHSNENTMLTLASGVAGLLPIDFEGNGGNPLITLAPTATQPLLQVGFNTDFTGRPIYKDNDFNKYDPSFQKAYIGTPKELISFSAKINELTGGNEHMQGWWERTKAGGELNNPAVWNHLLKGYFGGMYSMLAQTGGLLWNAYLGETPDVQEVPIANRIVTAVRETQQNGKAKLPDWYYDLSEESKRHQNEFSGYKKDYLKGDKEGKKKLDEIIKSKDFVHWQQVNAYIGAVQQIRTAMSYEQDEEEKQKLQKNLDEVLGELEKLR